MLRSMMESNPLFQSNPMLRQSMEAMLQNPEMLRQSMELMRNMGNGQFPDFNQMMQNPEVQRMMNDPNLMQQAMNAFGGGAGANPFANLFGQPGAAPSTASTTSSAPSTGSTLSSGLSQSDRETFYQVTGLSETPELNNQLNQPKAARAVRQVLEGLRNLRRENIQVFPTVEALASAPTTSAPAPQPVATVPPEERFASQLQQMNEMGLLDNDKNIRALLASNGNVNVAIEKIFNGFN